MKKTLLVPRAPALRFFVSLTLVCTAWILLPAQDATPQPSASTSPTAEAPQPVTTIKVNTRMVTLEVVARDHQGNPVSGLTAKDFEVSEQVSPKKDHRPQTISALQFVSLAGLKKTNQGRGKLPPGVYSNLVAMQQVPVPPTVLLMDGLNTDLATQLQARQQMVRMLNDVSPEVPMAIFLMDRRLHLVQNLTTDPKLLLQAAAKLSSSQAHAPETDPLDDPSALSAFMEEMPSDQLPPGALQALEEFERESYSANMDIRVHETLDSLRAIARYLAGYPGRKNLLWISSAFPLTIGPDADRKFAGLRVYQEEMDQVATALADAKVAVYPMDPGGLKTSSVFDVSSRPRRPGDPNSMGRALDRESNLRSSLWDTMEEVADKTGGRICVNNNDLANCVRTAVNDGTSYYELGYYPDSTDWHGEFHHVTVKTRQSGVHLAYRAGYYARSNDQLQDSGKDANKQIDPVLRQAACDDVLISTGIIMAAKALPSSKDLANYQMSIDPKAMTVPAIAGGGRALSMTIAACTFDKTGKPLHYSQTSFTAKLTDQQYAVMAVRGFPHAVALKSELEMARVRLLVRDPASGLMGSVEIPIEGTTQNPPGPPANQSH